MGNKLLTKFSAEVLWDEFIERVESIADPQARKDEIDERIRALDHLMDLADDEISEASEEE